MNANKKWVSAWGNAMSITERTPATFGKDITFRYPVPVPFDGEAVRLTFDNFCGTCDVRLTSAYLTVAVGDEQVQPNTAIAITFNQKEGVTLPQGKAVTSDEIKIDVRKGTLLSVSFYFEDFVELRSGVVVKGPYSRGNYSFGNHVLAEHLPLECTRNTDTCYFLSDVSVLTENKNKAVICYGDSITAQSWPDYLTQELQKSGEHTFSVVRKAVSGTRVLRQYSCATYEAYGLKGAIRYPHEIDSVSGAESIIIQQGINDVIHPVGVAENPFRPWSDMPTVDELWSGLTDYILWSKERGLKVYMGTLLPFAGWRTYADFREEFRREINERIRSCNLLDGVIDFDRVVRDERNPSAFAIECNSGDNLHPSELGYQKMAQEAKRVLCGE